MKAHFGSVAPKARNKNSAEFENDSTEFFVIPQNSIRIPQNPTHTQQHNTTNKSDQIKTKNPYQNGTQGRLGHELYVYCPRWYSSLKKVAAGSTTKTSVHPTPRLNASSSPKGSSVCLLNHEGILLHHSCRLSLIHI